MEPTRFRLRIYDLDQETGGPGADLSDQIIELKNTEIKHMRVNLRDHRIVIPDTKFFIAVEWLRNYHNFGYVNARDSISGHYKQQPNYRPAIGVSPVHTGQSHIWAMDFRQKWTLYTDYMPDFTDLAITATVSK